MIVQMKISVKLTFDDSADEDVSNGMSIPLFFKFQGGGATTNGPDATIPPQLCVKTRGSGGGVFPKVFLLFFGEAAIVLQRYTLVLGSKHTLKTHHSFFPCQ